MKEIRIDIPLLVSVLLLMGLGIVLVYSSSWALAERTYGDALFFLKRQAGFGVVAMFALLIGALVDPAVYEKKAYALLAVTLALLVAVLIPGVGPTIGIARRWIALGPFNLQAGEIAKFTLVSYLAMSIVKKRGRMHLFSVGILPHLLIPGMVLGLLLAEPDFGTTAMLFAVTMIMLFVGGARTSYLASGVLAAIPVGILLIATSPYRMRRVLAFLDPWANRYDIGYQVTESLMTFGSGGGAGLGLGDGRQKLFFLPAAHTDFIFAVLGEETGFVGVMVVLAAFATIFIRGISTSIEHKDPFKAYLALGLTACIVVQALFNMAVVLGLVPTKGLTLPFLSYGGSSLIMSGFVAGVLLRLSGEVLSGIVPARRPSSTLPTEVTR